MFRRTLLVLLIALHAATPGLAAACALDCALAAGGAAGPDCHESAGASSGDGHPPDTTNGDQTGDSPADPLMQAACAFASTASVVPSVAELARGPSSERTIGATAFSLSRATPPPQQPPRL